jgi:hypothetical protein
MQPDSVLLPFNETHRNEWMIRVELESSGIQIACELLVQASAEANED